MEATSIWVKQKQKQNQKNNIGIHKRGQTVIVTDKPALDAHRIRIHIQELPE